MQTTILIFFLLSVANVSKGNNDLHLFYEKVYSQAKILHSKGEKTENNSLDINNFYSKYFWDEKNIFKGSIDNWEDEWDCGLLSLKKACITEVFKTEIVTVDDNVSCINQYGVNEAMESLIIQSTTLFVKDNGDWKIVGSRHTHTDVKMMVYGLLNDDEPKDSFTDRCFNSEKLKKWQQEVVTDPDMYLFNPILQK